MSTTSPGKASAYPRLHTLRYMGSKLELVDFIAPVIQELAGGRGMADLMAGTHAIGYALKPHLRVWANDVQKYSQIIGLALLGPPVRCAPLNQLCSSAREYLDAHPPGYFETVYADTYFAPYQCREIDALRTAIAGLPRISQPLSLTALLATMSYCQSTPGHFAQFLPSHHQRVQALRRLSLIEVFQRKLEELHRNIVAGFGHNTVSCLPAESWSIPEGVGVGYLDPPYTSDQYSRFYHLLETAVLYDCPPVEHKARYRPDRFRSAFCYPRRVEGAFRQILNQWSQADRNLIISYSQRGLLPVEQLQALAAQYYRHVQVIPKQHRHSSMGKGEQAVQEVLVVASQTRWNTIK